MWWLLVDETGDGFKSHQQMDVSPTSPDVGDSLQMVLGTQSFRDEVQTMIAQQMKVESVPAANTSVPFAARGCVLSQSYDTYQHFAINSDCIS